MSNYKMIEVSNKKIIELAREYNEKKILWHNHFLPEDCIFNKSRKYQVVIENENSGEVYVSSYDKQPTKTLKLLENLFFEQSKQPENDN